MNLVEGFAFKSKSVEGVLNSTENPYAMSIREDIKNQYMMGDNILVAPMFAGEESRKVFLPAGKWYNFYTGDYVGENQEIEVSPGLDKIPLFVRDGGIIPMIPVRRNASGVNTELPLTIRHYGISAGSFQLYDDDGRTFDFEKGAYSFTRLSAIKDKNGKLMGETLHVTKGKPFGYKKEATWLFMIKSME